MQPDSSKPSRPRVQRADASLRPTRAEILLDAIGHNLRVVQGAAGGRKILAVVKADAYGHGVVPVARRLQADGVDGFGVALAEEGLELREAGIDRAILVLNGINGGAHREIIAAGLTPVLYEISEARAFELVSGSRRIDVHLKVDTGMGRLGVPLGELSDFLRELRRFPSIRIAGLMTHLSTADADRQYVAEQLAGFAQARGLVRRFGHEPSVLHVANSAALFRHPESHFDWVRTGLALYGYPGSDTIDAPLRPALRWRTEVLQGSNLASRRVGRLRTLVSCTRRNSPGNHPSRVRRRLVAIRFESRAGADRWCSLSDCWQHRDGPDHRRCFRRFGRRCR